MSFDIKIWGNNIWYLFHGLIHNLDDEKFDEYKNEYIYIFKIISQNLPCPECSKDAITIISKTKFESIKTKKELEKFIFNFHNHVNKKINKKEFDFEIIEQYKKINIDNVIHNFKIIFSKNSNIPELMGASFVRQRIIPEILLKLEHLKKYLINRTQ